MPMTSKPVKHDPAFVTQVNIVGKSPHVVAYRIWFRLPGATWQVIGDGATGDDTADLVTVPVVSTGTEVHYWLGVGGNPNTRYIALVTFSQNGKLLEGGTCLESGRTDGQGIAIVNGRVEFTS